MSCRLIIFPNVLSSAREFLEVDPGTTIREAVERSLPLMHYSGARLILNDLTVELSDDELRDGDVLIVRAVPGQDALNDTGKVMGGLIKNPVFLAGNFLTFGLLGLATAGLIFVYSAALSGIASLMPKLPKWDSSQTSGATSIHGGSNAAKPYGQVPLVLGKSIIAPPLGSKTFTTWTGDFQILNQLFVIGIGRLVLSAMKIGDAPLANFADATATTQTLSNDTYTQTVTEAGVNIECKYNVPQIQTTVADIDSIDLDISFPSGLTRYNSDGNRVTSRTVTFTVEYKKTTTGTWTGAASVSGSFSANKTQAITRQVVISAALLTAAGRAGYAGTWDVRVTRTLGDSTDSKNVDRSTWSVMRSYQLKEPMSTAAKTITTRVKLVIQATDQLNGAISNFNLEAQSVVPCWDGIATGAAHWTGGTALGLPASWKNTAPGWNTWSGDASSNPAALYLWVLRGPANPKPVPDSLIDWPAFEAWYTFCDTKALELNAVWDGGGPLLDVLNRVSGVGRGAPVMRDSKYSVIWDDVQTVPVQHFTPRNSWGFNSTKAFPATTHAVRAQFIDPDSGWKQAEQIVYMPGYNSGNATEFRTMEFWGVTNYQQACKAVWYALAVETLRPEFYEISVDIEHIACQRGDLVLVSHDVPMYGLVSARVVSFTTGGGDLLTVTLDEECTIEAATSYGLRWRRMDGTSVSGTVVTSVGTSRTLTFNGTLPADTSMEEGDLISFGLVGVETQQMLVVSVEPQDEFSAKVTLNNYDPDVYTADSGTPPVWSSGISLPPPATYGNVADVPPLSVPSTGDTPEAAAAQAGAEAQAYVSVAAPGYLGCFTVDPSSGMYPGDLYLYTTSLTTGAGDSVLRIYTLSGWADVTSPTSDQIALAQGDIFRRATFLEGGVVVPVRSTDFVLRLFSEFISAYSVQFQDTVGSTAGGGGTPTAGDMLIYMGKDPRLTGTRPYEFAIKEFIGSNGVQEEWMAHLLTKFLTSGMLALVLSGCLQATQVTSSPGKVWSVATHPFGVNTPYSVENGVGVWVAVAAQGNIARSTDDGVTWGSLITNPFGTTTLYTVGYGDGTWIAGGASRKIARSTDGGVTWGSLITNPFGAGDAIYSVSYGDGVWIAGGLTGKIARSTDDGVTWGSLITNPFGTTPVRSIKFGNGVWVAVAEFGKIARSTDDGVTWGSLITNPFGGASALLSVAQGNGVWVACGQSGKIARSTDGGVTWGSLISSPFTAGDFIFSASHGNGVWIATGTSGKIARSTDGGVTWAALGTEISPYGSVPVWTCVAFNDTGSFIAVGDNGGSAAYILRSVPLEAGGGVVGKGIGARGRYIDLSDGTRVWDTVNDSRITTGTVNRTETVVALEVGQSADINWACGVTGGVTRNITFQVPLATGTYQVQLSVGGAASNALSYTANNADELGSYGAVAQGSSVAVACSSGQSLTFIGFCKRLT